MLRVVRGLLVAAALAAVLAAPALGAPGLGGSAEVAQQWSTNSGASGVRVSTAASTAVGTMASVRVFGTHASSAKGFSGPDNVSGAHPAWFVGFGARRRFAFVVRGTGYRFRLRIDGRVTQSYRLGRTGGTLVRGTFVGSARHDVVVELESGVRFGGVIGAREPLRVDLGPRAIFVGDSYTTGTGAFAEYDSYVQAAAFALGLGDVWASGIDLSGYNNSGRSRLDLAQRLDHDVLAYRPAVVVIAHGFNDQGYPVDQLAATAGGVYGRIASALPAAKLVVVGPWMPQGPTPELSAIEDTLRREALAHGATFVSTAGWITAVNRSRFIGSDGTHPTPAGHRYIGQQLAAALQ
jgi:lysophospholipase L1-like esterase